MGELKNIPPAGSSSGDAIVFFDGVCVFCNARIDFLMRIDTQKKLKFSPLQGETARRLLPKALVEDLSTISLLKDGKVFTRSDAVLEAMISTGGVWGAVGRASMQVPRKLRDGVYNFVAQNRYKWFGKKEECRMPTPQERERFLP